MIGCCLEIQGRNVFIHVFCAIHNYNPFSPCACHRMRDVDTFNASESAYVAVKHRWREYQVENTESSSMLDMAAVNHLLHRDTVRLSRSRRQWDFISSKNPSTGIVLQSEPIQTSGLPCLDSHNNRF